MPRFRVVLGVWTDDTDTTADDVADLMVDMAGWATSSGTAVFLGMTVDVDEVTKEEEP